MREMGIDRALLDLIRTVKYEQLHVLGRDELIRFGIDKREFVETAWHFADRRGMPFIEKAAQQSDPKEPKGYRTLRWRISCAYSADAVRFDYSRSDGREGLASAVIRFGADQRIVMAATPHREVRGTRVTNAVLDRLKAASQLSLMEVSADAGAPPRETVVSTDGLADATDQLIKACRANLL
jgi:hypothetical protein